ncbi:hypothetical protein [Diaphorobacter sp. LR2014-1]|uniref:hypothetical protein n=1 Tax=Diaphorobacter sp. LR2014-1 TaxID=1933219 RepID=UPI000CDB9114|nr:hypothetical protein [Diaphorobacter sp. LR2014-1]POR07681.1 hypothetical protein BV908_19850 [Diaphorobacter sp. LR2014-1]
MKTFTIVSSNYTGQLFAWPGSIQENKRFLGNRDALGEIKANDEAAAVEAWRATPHPLDPRIGMLASGLYYAFVHGPHKPETIGTLAEVHAALGLQYGPDQACETVSEASTPTAAQRGAPTARRWLVTLRFAFPAWDEVDGILLGPFEAETKASAIMLARRQAREDGHTCTGKGRYWFTAQLDS